MSADWESKFQSLLFIENLDNKSVWGVLTTNGMGLLALLCIVNR